MSPTASAPDTGPSCVTVQRISNAFVQSAWHASPSALSPSSHSSPSSSSPLPHVVGMPVELDVSAEPVLASTPVVSEVTTPDVSAGLVVLCSSLVEPPVSSLELAVAVATLTSALQLASTSNGTKMKVDPDRVAMLAAWARRPIGDKARGTV
jgi:hypothetical protein